MTQAIIEWMKLLHGGAIHDPLNEKFVDRELQVINSPQVKSRFVLSFIVNSVIYNFIVQTAFLALIGNTDSMDYVKDCLAIAFITTIDDKDEDEPTIFVDARTVDDSMDRLTKHLDDPSSPLMT